MNIVFLDIDGVLNNLGSVVGLGSPSHHFDPVSVALVHKLCANGEAYIVVSSSWRCGNALMLKRQMREAGAGRIVPLVVDETPYLSKPMAPVMRGEEIDLWWKASPGGPYDRYVILDDDSDMLDGQPFVKTTFEDGFRFKHYIAALRYLKPEHPDCRDRAIIVPESGE